MKLIKFGASWCGPCGVMAKRLESFDKCELKEYDVDTYEAEELVDKYKVRNVPTLVLVDDKEEVLHRWTGLTPIEEINAKIDELNK